MDEKKLLMGLLSAAYKHDEKAATALLYNEDGTLKPDADQIVLRLDTDRVKTLSEDRTNYGKEQFDFGIRKSLETLESELKSTYGITSTKKGKELVDEIVALKAGKTGKEGEITEDEIKKHPYVVKLETTYGTKIKEIEDTYKGQLKEKDDAIEKDRRIQKVLGFGKKWLEENGAIFPENEDRKSAAVEAFEKELLQFDYQLPAKEGEKAIVLKDGKRYDDEHGHPIAVEDIFARTGKRWFDFNEGENRETGGDPTKKKVPEKKTVYKFTKPTNDADFAAKMAEIESSSADRKTKLEQRQALTELYRGKA